MRNEIFREVSATVDGLRVSVKRDSRGVVRSLEVTFGPDGSAAPVRRLQLTEGKGGKSPSASDQSNRGLESFLAAWRGPRGRLHRLWRPCTSAQLYRVYRLHCTAHGVGEPLRHDELSASLKGFSDLRIDRGVFRGESGQRKQLRCVFVADQAGPPENFPGRKADWLTTCIATFDAELCALQRSGVLPSSPPVHPRKRREVTR